MQDKNANWDNTRAPRVIIILHGLVNRFERFQDRDGNFYAFDHEVLAVVRVPAEPEIAEVLELAPDTDHVWKIKRLLKSNGELIILDEMFLNPRCFGEEVHEKIERLDPGQSMYAYFESEFCQKIASCSDVLRASFAQGDLVGYGFPGGSCVVILERVARNPKGEVLEFRRMTAVASKVQFAVED